MAVQAFPYLVMTDGTLTVTFADGAGGATSFAPLRGTWAPAIATRRRAALGRGPWDEVIEEWDLTIKGVDAATALSNLETLTRLLDNADRFWRLGEAVSPVLLKYVPQGSTLFTTANPATCLVLGRAPGDDTNLNLPSAFNDVGMLFEIRPVHLRFWRTGEWLNPTVETAATTAAANPTVQVGTFASTLTIASPLKLTVDFNFGGGAFAAGNASNPGVVLTATAANRLQIYEAEAATFSGPIASVADAAAKARGGSVARYTPGALSAYLVRSLSGFDTNARRVGVWAAVRNNSATTTWTAQCSASHNAFPMTFGAVVPIDASTLLPRIIFLGVLSVRLSVQSITIVFTASAAAGTLDMDYFVIQAIDDEASGAVVLSQPVSSFAAQAISGPTIIDARPLDMTTPLLLDSTAIVVLNYAGDAYLMSKGQAYAAVWLATSAAFWRTVDVFNNIVDSTWTANRYNGYLSPR